MLVKGLILGLRWRLYLVCVIVIDVTEMTLGAVGLVLPTLFWVIEFARNLRL